MYLYLVSTFTIEFFSISHVCSQRYFPYKGNHRIMISLRGTHISSYLQILHYIRVVSRFLSSRFDPKSRRLFPFYFSNITLRTDLLTFGVTGAVFKIAGEMCQLPAYFDNPVIYRGCYKRKNFQNSLTIP